MVTGYKALSMDMKGCDNFQFEVGKTYKIDNNQPLEICSDSGFHFCLNWEKVFNYFTWDNCRLFQVETSSDIVTYGDKSITKEITIIKEVTQEDLDFDSIKTNEAKYFYKIILEDNEDAIYAFKDDENPAVRRAVIKKLFNEKLIFETFKDDKDWFIRLAVVNKLTDKKLIFDTFKDDEHWLVRRAVVEKLTDEKLILETFKDDKSGDVRKAIIDKLTDEKLIYNTFKDDEYWSVRLAIVNKLSDKKLIYTFKYDKEPAIRAYAIKRLK